MRNAFYKVYNMNMTQSQHALTLSTPSNLMGCSMPMFHTISLVHSNFHASPFFRKGMFSNLKLLANSGDPDEAARYEPAHLDLHCLQMLSIKRSVVLKVLT